MMKFNEMKYERCDMDAVRSQLRELCEELKNAETFEQADAAFLKREEIMRHVATMRSLASVRNTIDTRDAFYDGEMDFWNADGPKTAILQKEWMEALLTSLFRKEFAEKYGEVIFINAELQKRSVGEAVVADMQKESALVKKYQNLLARAQVPFEGKTYTLSEMQSFMQDPDDVRREQAWIASGQWYKDHQKEMDEIYDELVHLRDQMGKKLGWDSYVQLGYDRMGRNCYTREDIEVFRSAVQNYVVPAAEALFKAQAERLGKEYPMSFADNELEFRTGNCRPQGTPDDIVKAGGKFYDELSEETSVFFRMMRENELMDLLSKEGKRQGGYCTNFPDYKVPFIFANFNGTQHDVEVVTHEAGHAFASWTNRDRVPSSTMLPSLEGCECHSMSMEFFSEEWAEDFFGSQAQKYRYSHLAKALKFIPYGTMVDHFQHEVYDHPEMTPAERHAVWKRLMGIYMPWQRLDGKIPFYSEGEHWQLKHHIYTRPFYYIDYCLAQTISLEFWALIRKDRKQAWDKYMKYTRLGGSKVWTELLREAGLDSPFEENTLKEICAQAAESLRTMEEENAF
ncbi:MAG: M3 family oligoendopeptidase [Solobacterium sp.]|nr:M3 family oligoendopeptidase [Solobacterium sp.]